MRRILLFLLFIPFFSIAQTKVAYRIFYSDKLEKDGLKVELSYKGKKEADSTYFHFANQIWGETGLLNCVQANAAENPGYRFKIVPDSNRIVVYHPKGKAVKFTYRIKPDYEQDKITIFSRPRIQHTYFHVLGENLFPVPEAIFSKHEPNPELVINLEWVGFPADFKIHNNFGSNQKKQVLKVKLWDELLRSVFVGGDYRIYTYNYLNKPVHFAIRGNWLNNYQDEKLFAAVKNAISTQRDFWKDDDFNYYTVIMSPTVTQTDSAFKGQSMKGTGLKNGFMIQSSNNPFNNWRLISYMFNHEMMHEWTGGKIQNKAGELNYWFSEGFTDYYAFKNRLRSKELSFDQWLQDFNKDVIKAHWENPEKNKPNYLIRDDYWKSRNIEKIPYRRGALFAFWLDNQILKKSGYTKSLDDLMQDLLKRCTTGNQQFSDELFLNLAQQYLDRDITYFFQKHVISGVDFDFTNEDLIDGFKIDKSTAVPKLTADKDLSGKYIKL